MVLDGFSMTPEEAFKRRNRQWRVTLAMVIMILVCLAAWLVDQITRVR
jgi:hypothetical protein